MSTTFLLACLVIAIVLILVVIIKFKISPAIALVLGALLLGVLAKIPVIDTVNAINSGFGNMLGSIGFPIGFGIILGQLVSDCGGANVIPSVWSGCSPPPRRFMPWPLPPSSCPSLCSLTSPSLSSSPSAWP